MGSVYTVRALGTPEASALGGNSLSPYGKGSAFVIVDIPWCAVYIEDVLIIAPKNTVTALFLH